MESASCASRRTMKWVSGRARARPCPPIGGAAGRTGAGGRTSTALGGAGWGRGRTIVASGAATRTGASAELPASLRGGGLGLAEAAGVGGLDTGLGAADGIGRAMRDSGFAEARGLPAGCLAAGLAATGTLALAAARGACFSRLACGFGALAGDGRLAEDEAGFAAGLRAAATGFAAGRLAPADLGCALPPRLRRAVVALAEVRALAAGRAARLAAGFATVLGFGRGVATRRVAVACLAGAAFFAFGAGLLTALPPEVRFPDPLAGANAFMRAISPSSTGRECGEPSTRLRVSP